MYATGRPHHPVIAHAEHLVWPEFTSPLETLRGLQRTFVTH